MKWYIKRLTDWKVNFEDLASAKLIDLANEPLYWRILDVLDEYYKKNYLNGVYFDEHIYSPAN